MAVLGMIGCGNWGGNWVRTLAGMPNVELRWCCDLNPNTLSRLRQQLPQVRTTAEVDDLFGDPSVDGVVIATIAPTHFDLARRALKAGKNVLVEKPLTLNRNDALALHWLAQK